MVKLLRGSKRLLPLLLLIGSAVLLAHSYPRLLAERDEGELHPHQSEFFSPRRPGAVGALMPGSNTRKAGPRRNLDRRGVREFVTTIRADWGVAMADFLDGAPVEAFSARRIRFHYFSNIRNVTDTAMLVTLLDGKVTFEEKYAPGRHSRSEPVKFAIREVVSRRKFPGVTFMVIVNDGYQPSVACFAPARHWKSWKTVIPVPMGNLRGEAHGWGTPLDGWDEYVDQHVYDTRANYSWEQKVSKAVFRGALGMQTYKLGSCNEGSVEGCTRATRWNDVNRGVLYTTTRGRPDLFDVGFTSLRHKPELGPGQFDAAPMLVEGMKFEGYQNYKYVINMGSNQDWAERLRSLLFLNSAVVMHEAETKEFFTPLLQAWVHYIPTNVMLTDLVQNVEWATKHDDAVQQIVRNQNAFADRYLSERAMLQYWEVAIEEFARLQAAAAARGLDREDERKE